MVALLATSFLVPTSFSQLNETAPPQTNPDDRSFYLDKPIVHPEALSGVWEISNGEGGTVGIHLQLATKVPGDADPPVWTPQSWQYLEVAVFERRGPELKFGEENYFSDSVQGGGVSLENGRLQLHFVSTWKDTPSVDLNLLLQPDGCWHGRFHRGSYDSVVNLCRSTAGTGMQASPLVGTWSSGNGVGCVHIFATGPRTFIGWSDALQIPGTIIFGRNIPKPHELYQTYGNLVKVGLVDNRNASLEFGAYNPMCCSHEFVGTLSADGLTLKGEFPPGPNQAPHAAIFTKMRGDSCVNPEALQSPTRCSK